MRHELSDIQDQYQNPDKQTLGNNRMGGCCPVCQSEDITLAEKQTFLTVIMVAHHYKCNNPECGATFL